MFVEGAIIVEAVLRVIYKGCDADLMHLGISSRNASIVGHI